MGAVKAGVGGVVEFRVLGPVEVWENGDPIPLGGTKARAVLAVLLLAGGRVVPVEKLIHLVWPEEPPASAPVLIRVYVSSLRKRLAEAGREQEVIRTRPPGYVVDLGPAELDSRRFADLVAEARRCHSTGDLTAAADAYGRALALWRGAALGGVGEVLRTEADRLEEMRLSVTEERISVDLALGRESDLVAEVRALWAAHPMRERLLGYLMTVLYRLGRQGEALEAFADGRRILAEELGVDPGPQLRALHQAVLRADQEVLGGPQRLDGTSAAALEQPLSRPSPPADRPIPDPPQPADAPAPVAQLPPAVADFTGRSGESAGLLARMRTAGTAGTTVPVCVIAGQSGSGKSALAVDVAHRLTEDFPDGQVYVELRGMGDAPAAPEDVLRRLLRDFGAGALSQPTGLEELSARYRSVLAGRRVLVVLDDAADERQVRSLLPGSPGTAVVVTSRNRLAGLAGAQLSELGVLTAEEGVELLARIVGEARVEQEPEAAQRIAALCGHLPLAIRIAGARLASRPDWSLARLAHRLSDELRRLDELAVGDQEVRAGIELSYRGLPGPAKRALRLLGVLGPPTFCATTLAVLLGSSLPDSEESIESLIDAQLVQSAGRDGLGRMVYRVHDLVGVFGRERAEAEDSRPERTAAVRRVLGGWLWLIEQISRDAPSGTISPRDAYRQAVPFDPALAAPFLADPLAWFEAEQDVLVAGVERAAALDLADLAGELTSALSGSLFVMFNRLQAWSRTLAAAIAAARRAGDTHGEARLLAELGELKLAEDRFAEARECLIQALAMFRENGDRQGELSALASLGAACREVGEFAEALGFLADAYRTAVQLGDDAGIGQVTRLRGSVWLELGDFAEAASDLELSLTAYRRASSRRGEALTLRTTSLLHRARGELDRAEAMVGQSLQIFRAVGDELLTAFALQARAKTRLRQGRPEGLVDDLRAALEVSRRHGDRFGAALSLRTLGELYLSVGRTAQARGCFAESVAIWDELQLPLFRARTLRDIARLLDVSGDPSAAAGVRSEALEIFRRYGAREAEELAAEAHCDSVTPAQV
jgi:DNA-binding SARP family transcriptional activator/tetratricopeptide (TPR) repeat protein